MSRPGRRPWTRGERFAYWLYGFFLGPFLTKHPDGTITGAMTRWAVALFTIAMVVRLLPLRTDTGYVVTPLGWPDALAVFFILFALPIDGALTAAARRNPEALVAQLLGAFGRGAPASGAAEPFRAHEWATGDPDEGLI